MFLSQNIFPNPKQLAFSVIIDDRKRPRVRFLLQWCSCPHLVLDTDLPGLRPLLLPSAVLTS